MRIADISVAVIEIPLLPERVVTSARGTHDRSPFAWVRIRTDDGLSGYGEVSCTAIWSGEDSATARHVISTYIAPALIGRDPRRITELTALADLAVHGHRFAKAGVEMALWDLQGKRHGLAIHELFGGATRDRIRTKFSLAASDPQDCAAVALWAVGAGFEALKVKVATGDGKDLERFCAVRDAVGSDVPIGVDANGGWRRDGVLRAAQELESAGASFVEQPLPESDLEGMAWLRRELEVPLVADESVGTPQQALDVVRAGAADILSIYVGMAGGIAAAVEIARLAHTAELGWTIGSNLELGVGLAAHIQLALAGPGLADDQVACDIISPFYYSDDVIDAPLPVAAGSVLPVTGPGLGVTIKPEVEALFR